MLEKPTRSRGSGVRFPGPLSLWQLEKITKDRKFIQKVIQFAVLVFTVIAVSVNLPAKSSDVKIFSTDGVLVNIQTFFKAVHAGADDLTDDGVSYLALITTEDVYAFLETPANKEILSNFKPGDAVRATGQLLHRGIWCISTV